MADQYIDSDYIDDHMGSDFRTALTGITGVDLTKLIEGATAAVQVPMRGRGYSPPSTTDPSTVEEAVKMATLGAFLLHVTRLPSVDIEIQDGNAAVDLYERLIDETKDFDLAANVDISASVGGWTWSKSTSTTRPQLASRAKLWDNY